jgi:hypothetical protein
MCWHQSDLPKSEPTAVSPPKPKHSIPIIPPSTSLLDIPKMNAMAPMPSPRSLVSVMTIPIPDANRSTSPQPQRSVSPQPQRSVSPQPQRVSPRVLMPSPRPGPVSLQLPLLVSTPAPTPIPTPVPLIPSEVLSRIEQSNVFVKIHK